MLLHSYKKKRSQSSFDREEEEGSKSNVWDKREKNALPPNSESSKNVD